MRQTLLKIPKMDCPSEEHTVRMALEGSREVAKLDFDLAERTLTVYHHGAVEAILLLVKPLGLGADLLESKEVSVQESGVNPGAGSEKSAARSREELSVLKKVFALNGTMFLVGLISGWIADSAGLLSDSLDMFADATVFGLSMYAVGRSLALKKRAARLSGFLQMALALGAFFEVVRRFFLGSSPESPVMIAVAAMSLIVNATCMYLLARHRNGEVHMRASWIFLSNDVVANAGVIAAGILVKVLNSHVPDLVIGAIISAVVFSGSVRILKASA